MNLISTKNPSPVLLYAMRDYISKDYLSGQSELDVKQRLIQEFDGKYDMNEVHAAADQVSAEYALVLKDPGTYLVDQKTGRMLFKMTPDMVYQPPASIGEDGKPRSQAAMVHPKISSGIALSIQEQERELRMIESVPTGQEESVAHLKDPHRILEHAHGYLQSFGIKMVAPSILETEETFAIGVENADGMLQAPNFGFHRSVTYAASLARKIKSTGTKQCGFVSIERKRSAKKAWFDVTVRLDNKS